jgi:hypothetical protein
MVACFAAFAPSAYAYMEPSPRAAASGCSSCHDAGNASCAIPSCHGYPDARGYHFTETGGPHGNYTKLTDKCSICHTLHDAPMPDVALLPAATVVATCFTCHDSTQGWGVYGTIEARGGTVGGGHPHESTRTIPGGDGVTGGDDATRLFSGPGGALICSDCHSPHGTDLVDPFVGERNRLRADMFATSPTSSRLLRRRPTGASFETSSYGSDWCLACHAGRSSGGPAHNHPADSSSNQADPYTYDRLPVLDSSSVTTRTVIGQLGGSLGAAVHGFTWLPRVGNRGFLMPYPRTTDPGGQAGHYPICQQCHEDSRFVGTLVGDGSSADAATFTIAYADSVTKSGSAWVTTTVDNPRFQNFPHETENPRLLVETADTLCLNCHPPGTLP